MVLFAIVGELGAGKTLALCYLAWRNWFRKNRHIYANFDQFGYPFKKVTTLPDFDRMKEGFFAGDELWLWIDSWATKDEKKKMVSNILLKSRKRDLTIAYTTQGISQVVKRVRDVTDFIAYPLMSVDGTYCRVEIFRGPRANIGTRINPPLYFNCEPVYAMYNTYEEVQALAQEATPNSFDEKFTPIAQNPAFLKYCRIKKKLNEDKSVEFANAIQKMINPEGVVSEEERKEQIAEYEPI